MYFTNGSSRAFEMLMRGKPGFDRYENGGCADCEDCNNRLLPLTVIEAAAGGDVEAINAVLKHYAGYIARLSMRELYDEYGNPHLCVDEELRRRLETKLITKLLTFRVR